MTFGKRLKTLRTEKSLTQEQLVNIINNNYGFRINKGMISKWENDKEDASMSYIIALAKYFDVSLDYLLALSNERVHLPEIIKYYNTLNPTGQAEATKRVYELTQIKEYTNVATETADKIISYNDIVKMDIPMAAHENEGATMEMKEEDLNNALKLVQKDRT
ncbi:helix-turn-helix domain-containing protein [Enterocloster bolteae]|uniref:helix-turn-helix domain-containing protein n=1 Tax=Enterocloster bolteae TaxID=208479 RepID=UPI0002D18BAA|nr:helix-turn-helix transcriptional regulator [Enterocloster bolteae]ENZ39273.1 hypothetical protein HMPREF1089_03903 [Enterocloster bolteae 90B3]